MTKAKKISQRAAKALLNACKESICWVALHSAVIDEETANPQALVNALNTAKRIDTAVFLATGEHPIRQEFFKEQAAEIRKFAASRGVEV